MANTAPRDVVRIHPDTTEYPGPGDIGIVESVGIDSARLYTDADTVRWLAHEELERIGRLNTGEPYTSSEGQRFVEITYERGFDGATARFEIDMGPQMALSGRMIQRSRFSVLRDALHWLVQAGAGCLEEADAYLTSATAGAEG